MDDTQRYENKFMGFEYKTISVHRNMEAVYTDSYPSFGWNLAEESIAPSINNVVLKFKRNRKIINKAELTRLEREFEVQAKEIEKLEESRLTIPIIIAYGIGIIGTVFMAGSMFSYLANLLPLCIALAVPAFIGWIIPYFAYKNISQKKTKQILPIIDRQYDAVYKVCEKASELLYN